jgi:hypothetical protein
MKRTPPSEGLHPALICMPPSKVRGPGTSRGRGMGADMPPSRTITAIKSVVLTRSQFTDGRRREDPRLSRAWNDARPEKQGLRRGCERHTSRHMTSWAEQAYLGQRHTANLPDTSISGYGGGWEQREGQVGAWAATRHARSRAHTT